MFRRKRGQVWSADFIASMIVFFTAVAIIIFAWNYIIGQNQEQLSLNEIENTALSASDSLIRSPGIPYDWDETSVTTLGIAEQENVLNTTKASMFLDMDELKIKSLLGISNFEFYWELAYLNGSLIQDASGQDMKKGAEPAANSRIVVPVQRLVVYDGLPAKMAFLLWS